MPTEDSKKYVIFLSTMATPDERNAPVDSALATLQPLRDLAKNWDIDIASCLEEYLNEIVDVLSLSPDSSNQLAQLNFAEAALVLQNSSHIYSRKVEYLYALVYKALDDLVTTRNDNKPASRRSTSKPEVDDFFAHHTEDFLLLDDVLPTDATDDCRAINLPTSMKDDSWSPAHPYPAARWSLGRSLSTTLTPGSRRQSLSSRLAASTSASRLQLGALENGQALLRLVDGQCDLAANGCLLLPGSRSNSRNWPVFEGDGSPMLSQKNPMQPDDDGDDDMMGAYDDNDDNKEGTGFDMAIEAVHGDNTARSDEKPLTAGPVKRVGFAPSTKPERVDPWMMLDPHAPDTRHKARPLRIGNTLRLPPGVVDVPSASVTGARTKKSAVWTGQKVDTSMRNRQASSFAVDFFHAAQASNGNKRTLETASESISLPLEGLAFGAEFVYLARQNAQRQAAERRERRKLDRQAKFSMQQEELEEEAEQDDDWAYGGGNDYDDGDDNDVVDKPGSNTGLASLDDAYQHDGNDYGDHSHSDAPTFEELCRAHLQKFAQGAEKFASETSLSRRVHEWQDRLVPMLEEEEARPEFDMAVYGRNVITALEDELAKRKAVDADALPVVDFARVTMACPKYEVCRRFLALLSLSNGGNVELGQTEKLDGLHLRLLDSHMDQPMESYQLPNVSS